MKNVKWMIIVMILGGAHNLVEGQVKVGVFSGIYHSQAKIEGLSTNILPDIQNRSFVPGGVVVDYALDDKFSFSSGLTYNSKGFQISESTNVDLLGISLPIGVKANTNIHALEIPLHLKLNLGNDNFIMYGMAGPRLNMNLDGEIRTFASTIVDIPLTTTNIDFGDRNFNRMTIGGDIGLGFESSYNQGAFFGEVLYQADFGQTIHEETIQSGIKLNGVSMRLGYKMTLF
jgi:hypothetical protein